MASKAGSRSYGSKRAVPSKPPNFVHDDSMHRETIRKELDHFRLRTDFFINPYQPGTLAYLLYRISPVRTLEKDKNAGYISQLIA